MAEAEVEAEAAQQFACLQGWKWKCWSKWMLPPPWAYRFPDIFCTWLNATPRWMIPPDIVTRFIPMLPKCQGGSDSRRRRDGGSNDAENHEEGGFELANSVALQIDMLNANGIAWGGGSLSFGLVGFGETAGSFGLYPDFKQKNGGSSFMKKQNSTVKTSKQNTRSFEAFEGEAPFPLGWGVANLSACNTSFADCFYSLQLLNTSWHQSAHLPGKKKLVVLLSDMQQGTLLGAVTIPLTASTHVSESSGMMINRDLTFKDAVVAPGSSSGGGGLGFLKKRDKKKSVKNIHMIRTQKAKRLQNMKMSMKGKSKGKSLRDHIWMNKGKGKTLYQKLSGGANVTSRKNNAKRKTAYQALSARKNLTSRSERAGIINVTLSQYQMGQGKKRYTELKNKGKGKNMRAYLKNKGKGKAAVPLPKNDAKLNGTQNRISKPGITGAISTTFLNSSKGKGKSRYQWLKNKGKGKRKGGTNSRDEYMRHKGKGKTPYQMRKGKINITEVIERKGRAPHQVVSNQIGEGKDIKDIKEKGKAMYERHKRFQASRLNQTSRLGINGSINAGKGKGKQRKEKSWPPKARTDWMNKHQNTSHLKGKGNNVFAHRKGRGKGKGGMLNANFTTASKRQRPNRTDAMYTKAMQKKEFIKAMQKKDDKEEYSSDVYYYCPEWCHDCPNKAWDDLSKCDYQCDWYECEECWYNRDYCGGPRCEYSWSWSWPYYYHCSNYYDKCTDGWVYYYCGGCPGCKDSGSCKDYCKWDIDYCNDYGHYWYNDWCTYEHPCTWGECKGCDVCGDQDKLEHDCESCCHTLSTTEHHWFECYELPKGCEHCECDHSKLDEKAKDPYDFPKKADSDPGVCTIKCIQQMHCSDQEVKYVPIVCTEREECSGCYACQDNGNYCDWDNCYDQMNWQFTGCHDMGMCGGCWEIRNCPQTEEECPSWCTEKMTTGMTWDVPSTCGVFKEDCAGCMDCKAMEYDSGENTCYGGKKQAKQCKVRAKKEYVPWTCFHIPECWGCSRCQEGSETPEQWKTSKECDSWCWNYFEWDDQGSDAYPSTCGIMPESQDWWSGCGGQCEICFDLDPIRCESWCEWDIENYCDNPEWCACNYNYCAGCAACSGEMPHLDGGRDECEECCSTVDWSLASMNPWDVVVNCDVDCAGCDCSAYHTSMDGVCTNKCYHEYQCGEGSESVPVTCISHHEQCGLCHACNAAHHGLQCNWDVCYEMPSWNFDTSKCDPDTYPDCAGCYDKMYACPQEEDICPAWCNFRNMGHEYIPGVCALDASNCAGCPLCHPTEEAVEGMTECPEDCNREGAAQIPWTCYNVQECTTCGQCLWQGESGVMSLFGPVHDYVECGEHEETWMCDLYFQWDLEHPLESNAMFPTSCGLSESNLCQYCDTCIKLADSSGWNNFRCETWCPNDGSQCDYNYCKTCESCQGPGALTDVQCEPCCNQIDTGEWLGCEGFENLMSLGLDCGQCECSAKVGEDSCIGACWQTTHCPVDDNWQPWLPGTCFAFPLECGNEK
eukprot:gnl/MRDRNA2_/MRDRNA2_99625_c0_seq1.p1 gnl/MRDRNA2_/MRDRNA2_99625_c0~~gnl/MRDRNA2_/MRDRNA2_99625_c0_seq1.p1  ORF type:complete len:1709 (+),score=216.47 gnl/MRDRNA2_/MRDRNA2_99625_c0_seq1:598-5127(+)